VFEGATFIVAAHLAGWYGTTASPEFLFPFAAMFGGIAQFAAGMWAFRARDGLATAMHGMWGAFWMAYGILFLLPRRRHRLGAHRWRGRARPARRPPGPRR
jgi:succinate-acetate transporter protein